MQPAVDYTNIDQYILGFPAEVIQKLEELRATIQQAAPKATEVISYQMPAFKYCGMLVYFAAYKNHIGLYPTGSGIAAFAHEFGGLKWSKGTVQFPLNEPLPLDLITRIVKYRYEENQLKAEAKKKAVKK